MVEAENKTNKRVNKFSIVVYENGEMGLEDASEKGMVELEQGHMIDFVLSFAEILKEHVEDLKMERMIAATIDRTISNYIHHQRELYEELSQQKNEDEGKSPKFMS